jgi:hypothetical protein
VTGFLLRDDSNSRFICRGKDGLGVEHECSACFDGETRGAGGSHGFDGGDADDGDVEAHVLVGFGDLDYGKGAAEGGFCPRTGGYFMVYFIIKGAEEGSCAGDGGVSAFHSLDGDAGLGGDDDGLAEVVGGDGLGDGAAIGYVLLLLLVGFAEGEDAGLCEEWFEVLGGGDELDALVAEDLCDCSQEHVGVAGAEVEEELGESPVGADAGEDLLVFDLAGHGGAGDAFGLEGFDEAGEFAEGEPVDVDVGVGCGAGVDLGVGLFVDGGDDDGEAVGACCVEEEEGEAAIAGDQA